MRLRLTILAFAICAVCSCSQGPAPATKDSTGTKASSPATKGTIGLSVLTLTNPFFKEIVDVMTAECAKKGYTVLAISGDLDPAKQQNQVKDFIVKRTAAIVLTPCDSRAMGPAIREANAAGIPVFTADIACVDPSAKVVSHIATDNYGGGRAAAKALVEALGNKGKVAILDYPEVESVTQRTRGFEDELKDSKANLTIVARLPGGGEREKSYKATQDLLQAHADLAGIFAINDPSALGAVAALEKLGKLGQVKVVGFDGQPPAKLAIRDGKIFASPIQFPDEIAKKTAASIFAYLAGEEVPREQLIPTKLYRQADAKADASLR